MFGDRYHATILRTPRQVRSCVAYVLNNWRRHGEDRGRTWLVDPFSSAISFGGWKELDGLGFRPPMTYASLVVWFPKTVDGMETPRARRRARRTRERSSLSAWPATPLDGVDVPESSAALPLNRTCLPDVETRRGFD